MNISIISQKISNTKNHIYQGLAKVGTRASIDWPIIVLICIVCVFFFAQKSFSVYNDLRNPASTNVEVKPFGAEAFSKAKLNKAIELIDKKTALRESAKGSYTGSADPSL